MSARQTKTCGQGKRLSFVTSVANTHTNGKQQTNKQTTGQLVPNFLAAWIAGLQPTFPACLTTLLVSSCSLIKFRQELFDRGAFYLPEPQHFNKTSTHTNLIKRHIFRCAVCGGPWRQAPVISLSLQLALPTHRWFMLHCARKSNTFSLQYTVGQHPNSYRYTCRRRHINKITRCM
jgi:hypothetical protein